MLMHSHSTNGSLKTLALTGILLLSAFCSHAYVLDWETSSTGSGWTSASNTISNVNGSGINITVSVTGDNIINSTPTVTNSPVSTGGNSLLTDVDWDNAGADTLNFTISFSGVVDSVDFTLHDIDIGNFRIFGFPVSVYQDEISNIAATGTGVSGPTLTTSLDNQISGSTVIGIASDGDTGNPLGNENDALSTGDVGISFTGTDIDQITFSYTKGPSSPANPTLQRIALGDIQFTVPEPGAWVALVSLLFCITLFSRRRLQPTQARADM